ncbi:hypothetical protein [Mucilaginibacter auburnensis]|uniref:Peptidase S74 domain-containing protein n=1 Tax=Mucilaginibacter auburnensis TaxID=1457233 RepID=A0A2H9VRW7_9SPHI|nr:hypothetical protein [Mucilaginibacter auburnensis]PJJ83553.1 hypothetical protein CLV57_0538 [Mucilaginibacter auburnensis]
MKATYLSLLVLLLLAQYCCAQTNVFPTPTGNVGIATTNPLYSLTLGGTTNAIAHYNELDGATNYEMARMGWNGDVYQIATLRGGTGTTRNLKIGIGSTTVSRYFEMTNTPSASGVFTFNLGSLTSNTSGIGLIGTYTSSGSMQSTYAILPTINQTGTASYRGLWISPYEQSTGSGVKYLIDAGVNSAVDGSGSHASKFVVTNTGKVGIGTVSPLSQIHVSGTVAGGVANSALFGNTDASNGATARIYLSGSDKTTRSAFIEGINVAAGNNNEHALAFGTSSPSSSPVERMRIDQNGNVGIGTTNPNGYKLAVNGKIRTKEVRVEVANWPDYVFKPSYSLPTLVEVKRHIGKIGHLPGIPSAQETERSGVDVGEMNSLLLKKVEELTLYLIEENAKNIKQQIDIEQQQDRIKALEAALLKLTVSK